MKLVESKAELIQQEEGLSGLYRHIELCGRTCYKSEDKITDDSAPIFVDNLIKRGHTAMLEHGTVYLEVANEAVGFDWISKYANNPYSRVIPYTNEVGKFWCVTTNLRVIHENGWDKDLDYLVEPNEHHVKRYTFKLTTSIGVTRELNRHRIHSIAEQSTRYCNYSKDKFDNQISFCKPSWLVLNTGEYECLVMNDRSVVIAGDGFLKDFQHSMDEETVFLDFCLYSEQHYMKLIKAGWAPQQARELLPLCTATEIIHTAFEDDWKHFFDLRYFEKTGKVHPNMLELTTKMKEECEKAGIWTTILEK